MENISFLSLMHSDICIADISCVEYNWNTCRKNEYLSGRDQNVLSLTIGASKKLISPDDGRTVFEADDASIFFIARNTPYITHSFANSSETAAKTICIKFSMMDENGREIVLSKTDRFLMWKNFNMEFFKNAFFEVIHVYMAAQLNALRLKSAMYRLFEALVDERQEFANHSDKFEDILPAIMYIENNLKNGKSAEELAAMCFMSKSNFSRRFKKYTDGVCLADYRNRLRIQKAKELLESPMWSVTLVAETLGFYDKAHFYKIFKKYTGEMPKSYIELKTEKNKKEDDLP